MVSFFLLIKGPLDHFRDHAIVIANMFETDVMEYWDSNLSVVLPNAKAPQQENEMILVEPICRVVRASKR